MTVPQFDPAGSDPRAASDVQRTHGPLARTPGGWAVLGHAEAREVARDPQRFSSAVSRFLQVPNGLDGAEHAAFRAALDPYFAPEEMQRLAPVIREVAERLIDEVLDGAPTRTGIEVDAVAEIGAVFAVRGQTRWLGWPESLEQELLAWMRENHAASRSGELARTSEVAERFNAIIRSVLAPRRAQQDQDPAGEDIGAAGARTEPDDITSRLMRQTVTLDGQKPRPLREEEIVSILRNWTGGDLGSIALCTGVVLTGLATTPQPADRIRRGSDEEAIAIIDELLRIDDPFVSNRRVTTCPVTLAGQDIPAGERIILHWTSANRDERAFTDPDAFDPEGHADRNLVWGTGAHVCPGRPLAMLELLTLLRVILERADLAPAAQTGEREIAPVGGWRTAPVRLMPR